MRLRSFAPAALTLAAVLALPACGGDSDDTTASSSSSSSASSSAAPETTDGSGDADTAAFCAQAQDALDATDAAFAAATSDPSQLSAALQTATAALSDVTPPADIATDWQTLIDAGQLLADGTAGVDISTPEGATVISDLDAQLTSIGADQAGADVEQYVTSTCGAPAASTS